MWYKTEIKKFTKSKAILTFMINNAETIEQAYFVVKCNRIVKLNFWTTFGEDKIRIRALGDILPGLDIVTIPNGDFHTVYIMPLGSQLLVRYELPEAPEHCPTDASYEKDFLLEAALFTYGDNVKAEWL